MKEYKVYVGGKNTHLELAERADYTMSFGYKSINCDQIVQLIPNYSTTNKYKVVLDSISLYTLSVMKGTDAYKNMLTVIDKRELFGKTTEYTTRLDIVDLAVLAKTASKHNLDIYVNRSNSYISLKDIVSNAVIPGNTYEVFNWHTPEDLGTAYSYLTKMLRNKSRVIEVQSEYVGSDSVTKLYIDEPITLVVDDLNLYAFREYQLTPKTIKLSKDDKYDYSDRSYYTLDNALVHIKGGLAVDYTANTMRHSAYQVSLHGQKFSLVSETVNKDSTIGIRTSIIRNNIKYTVSTKYNRRICKEDQKYYAKPVSFKLNDKLIVYSEKVYFDEEKIKSIKTLTGYEVNNALEAEEWLKPETLDYMVNFNSSNGYYQLSNMESVLHAACLMKSQNHLTVDTITLVQLPREDKIYEDSERVDEEDVYISQLEVVDVDLLSSVEHIEKTMSISEALELELDDSKQYTIHIKF